MSVSVDVATTTSESEMNCHPQATELLFSQLQATDL